jgi:hypothetical protein
MAIGTNLTYNVNTPPYSSGRHAGALWSIMARQYRFCAFEGMAENDLDCGIFVTMVTDAMGINRFKPLSGAGDKIFGVTYLNTQRLLLWNDTRKVFYYQKDEIVSLIEEGDVFMYSETAVNAGDSVFTRHTADGANTRISALANATGTGLVAVPGAKFLKAITAPGIVSVSLPDFI